MNIIKLIADYLENPKGEYDRMLGMGVPHDVIDAILALDRDKSARFLSEDISLCGVNNEWTKLTFLVKDI